MCGIFAYLNYCTPTTRKQIIDVLLGGLYRLEYRGYDSAGVAVDASTGETLHFKSVGPVQNLEDKIVTQDKAYLEQVQTTHCGIAHTRWATHGQPAEVNAHPQTSQDGSFAVVHNGILSNYSQLKGFLEQKGQKFVSQTDTEVVPQLAQYFYELRKGSPDCTFPKIVKEVVSLLEGTYALVFKSTHFPNELVAIRSSSPLIMGIKTDPITTEKKKKKSGEEEEDEALTSALGKSLVGTNMNVKHTDAVSIQKNDPSDLFVSPTGKKPTYPTSSGKSGGLLTSLDYKRIASLSTDPEKQCHFFLSSDVTAIIEHTNNVVFLEDGDVLHIKDGTFSLTSLADEPVSRDVQKLTMTLDEITKGDFKHFMLKEIMEQPETIYNTMRGRVNFSTGEVHIGGLQSHLHFLKKASRLIFIACGTSYHSTLATRQLIEHFSNTPVCIELASDFLDRQCPIYRNDACIFVSQSGETADTLQALKYCSDNGALCVGITNVVSSSIANLTDCGIYLNAGSEVSVASTKAYTSQITALTLLALQLASDTTSLTEARKEVVQGLKELPDKIREVLQLNDSINKLSERFLHTKNMLILGRGRQFATTMEASLKIKEISYIHTEGVLSGELKHGPLALVDADMPIFMIATHDELYHKVYNAFQQVVARRGKPIIICNENDKMIPDAEEAIIVPKTCTVLQGIVNIIPMQLLSYHIAVRRGYNVDKPRNLAKSVTVSE